MAHCKGMLPEKTLLIFIFGILMWFCTLSCRCLDLKLHESHPWWKVNLGTNHCLGRITLVNRGDSFGKRLIGAVVRAGVKNNLFNNAACGSPLTFAQASIPGAHIQLVCDPPVIARYVSVDDNDHINSDNNILTLCEVMVEEYPMEDCLQTTTAMTLDTPFAIAGTILSSVLFEGKYIVDPCPISVVHIKPLVQCFLHCKKNNECLSFDYVMTSGLYKLYDVEAGDLKVDAQPDCLVYAVVRG